MELSASAERYTLTAPKIDDSAVLLNGRPLQLDSLGELPPLRGVTVTAGNVVELAPASITFLAVPEARNRDCQ